ncbi:hypothetical protein THAOC_27903 [Thalassiosira oceanica]|uniref:Uncharacterized protein n=1 Tax=Thalassiosira oceanica TaxID=159749 RepID=K0RHS6_THAOC|nr:hypothetical protein THAOC_27903 [Thalassiosira oceanica]|eukprot:EJK52790.1 hypothetical protein THAOC_27903 [Thalassiosira oceanica]
MGLGSIGTQVSAIYVRKSTTGRIQLLVPEVNPLAGFEEFDADKLIHVPGFACRAQLKLTKSRKRLDAAFIVVAPHLAVVAGTPTVREPGAVLLSVVVVTVLAFGFVAAKIDANPGKTRARVALDLPVGTRMAAPVRDLGAVRRQGRIVVEARLFRVVVAADLLTVMSAPDGTARARAPVRGLCACLILVAPFLVAVAFTALGSIRASPGPLTETVAQNLTGVARDFVIGSPENVGSRCDGADQGEEYQ